MKEPDENTRVPRDEIAAAHAMPADIQLENVRNRPKRTKSLLALALLLWQWARSTPRKPPRSTRHADAGQIDKAAAEDLNGIPNCPECAENVKRNERPSHALEIEPVSHEQIGTFLVLCAFLVALGGGIGFLFLYWTGGSNILLGVALALCLAGLGMTLVLWSHLLTLKKQVVEPREQMQSDVQEREPAAEDFETGANQIHRRGLLKWMIAGGLGTVAAMVVTMFRSLGPTPDTTLYSTVWKRGQRLMTSEGKPVKVDMLQPGSTVIVFPENSIGSEKSQTVLVRVEEALIQLPYERSDWAPQGNLAFSRVCTHAGCAVGMYETTTHQLMCPCHQSTFDVLHAAEPSGGPADRPLPQLPLYVDPDGTLRAGGGFSDIPGPGFWGMS